MIGADRIMYAVDYPYIISYQARMFLENAPIRQRKDRVWKRLKSAQNLAAITACCTVSTTSSYSTICPCFFLSECLFHKKSRRVLDDDNTIYAL